MKITAIKQQVKQKSRYSIYVDGSYSFSLSEAALLERRLASGQELSKHELAELTQASADDKVYNLALRYVAMRPRSEWEVNYYLQRKSVAPEASSLIVERLRNLNFIDDNAYARAFVRDKQAVKPMSTRALLQALKLKRIDNATAQAAIESELYDEDAMLRDLIVKKRRQTRYQDNTKLMQYLARQGFGYDSIKRALANND